MKSGKKTFILLACGVTAVFTGLFYLLLGDRFETAEPVIKSIVTSKPAEDDNSLQTALSVSGTAETSVCETPYTESETVTETITRVTAEFPLDINYASAEELTLINGIGETLAGNIIAYRNEHGFFYSTEELLNVKGIGKSKLGQISGFVYVDASLLPETTAKQTSSTAGFETLVSKSTSAATTVTATEKRKESKYETSASTVTAGTVTVTVTTEDTDDGIIIEEITDFTDFTSNSRTEYSGSEVHGGNKTSAASSDSYRPNFPLELNTASARDLACIDGIGEAIAARIVEYAKSRGFYEVDDLLNVSGIGQSKLQSIRPYVYVNSSGLPPRTETTVSSAYSYDPFGYGNNYTSNGGQTQTPQTYRVNVNTGSKADFMQLPGIDETLAESIISFRSQIGGFQKLEELALADGMTTGKLSGIWNYIYL